MDSNFLDNYQMDEYGMCYLSRDLDYAICAYILGGKEAKNVYYSSVPLFTDSMHQMGNVWNNLEEQEKINAITRMQGLKEKFPDIHEHLENLESNTNSSIQPIYIAITECCKLKQYIREQTNTQILN